MRGNYLKDKRVVVLCVLTFLVGFSFPLTIKANQSPVITTLTANLPVIYYSSSTTLTVVAYDLDGDTLTYTWTATTGTIIGNKETALYQAPCWAGDVVVTVKVEDGQGGVEQSTTAISVVIAQYSTQINNGISAPARITTDDLGNIYVTDAREGKVVVYNPLGEIKLVIAGLPLPSGITVSQYGEKIYIVDQREKTVFIYNEQGEKIGTLGEYTRPNDLAILKDGSRIYVTDDRANLVKVYDFSSEQFYTFGSESLISPTGITIDEDKGKIYIANKRGTTIQVFDLDRTKRTSFAQQPLGSDTTPSGLIIGGFLNVQGLTFDPRGYLFGVDSTWAKIQVFDVRGDYPEGKPFPGNPFIGNLGTNFGELKTPVDAVVDCFRRLLVTNLENGRIEIYNLKDAEKPRIITRPAGAQAVKEPDPTFYLRDYYVFPNPAKRGKKPVIHLECGIADKVEIKIYNVAAEPVHSVEIDGKQRKSNSGYLWYEWGDIPKEKKFEWAYEYPWDISDIASGVYVAHIRATKVGYPEIKVLSKFAVIK